MPCEKMTHRFLSDLRKHFDKDFKSIGDLMKAANVNIE